MFFERLRELRVSRNMTQSQLADLLGVAKSTVSMYENGKREPDLETLEAIADIFNVDLNSLAGSKAVDNIFKIQNIMPLPYNKMIPLVGNIACGKPILAEENIETMVSMPEHIHADFALRCKGDSMINARILDNDIVYIRKQETVENGEIAAVLIDNEATLKRFYRYGDTVILRAENPTCKEFEYSGEKLNEIRILGKAVFFLSCVK